MSTMRFLLIVATALLALSDQPGTSPSGPGIE